MQTELDILRAQIATLTAEYLAAGGTITVLPPVYTRSEKRHNHHILDGHKKAYTYQ